MMAKYGFNCNTPPTDDLDANARPPRCNPPSPGPAPCPPRPNPCFTRGPTGPTGPQGPQGPAGPQGEQGPAGPQGIQGPAGMQGEQGPAGPQGLQGATGPQGDQGPAGAQGLEGPAGPQGPQGLVGPQGPQGIQGLQGPQGENGQDGTSVTILGSYDTLADLEAAHPTGNVGDSYLVGGELYIWDAVNNQWVNVGNIQGPTGPAGPQGVQGPAGAQGLQGAVGPTGPQGDQGPMGPQGLEGPAGTQGAQGPAGPQGEQGPIGPQGAQGPVGPQGEQGPIGPQGVTGPTGPQGAAGGGTIIPIAANNSITPTTNSSGALTITRLLGFGSSSGYVTVSGGTTFSLNADDEFVVFTMPYNGIITTVAGQYSTVALWTAPSNMSLYIAVAIAPQGSNTFTIIDSSKALAPPYVLGQTYPIREPRYGIAQNLAIPVPQGSRIAVLAGYENTGGTVAQSLPFNFTGSIAIEHA